MSAIRAQTRNVASELQAIGGLQAMREVLLAPDTSGRVTAIHFEAGQAVVQLYDSPEQAGRAATVVKVEFAQLQLQRSQQLVATGAEPHELLQQHQAKTDEAVAAVRQLDAIIQQKSIREPFAGQLGIRHINLGCDPTQQ